MTGAPSWCGTWRCCTRSGVTGVINLSVPFMQRSPSEPVGFWESQLGPDFYIVHFNRQPGVADALFAANNERFLRNIYRTKQWLEPAGSSPGSIVDLATREEATGELIMSDAELKVFLDAFAQSGYTGGINWYRNFTRNWETTAEVPQHIEAPALMIYGQYDMVPQFPNLTDFVPNTETHTLPCGHWIQQEQPEATNQLMLDWLGRHYPSV